MMYIKFHPIQSSHLTQLLKAQALRKLHREESISGSAPVLSEKDGSVMGNRCPGCDFQAIHKMAICANASKPEIAFRRSSCKGMSRDRKSCNVYCPDNQRMVDSSSLMNPPMPQEWPCAYASAAARPLHQGFGLNRTYGDT